MVIRLVCLASALKNLRSFSSKVVTSKIARENAKSALASQLHLHAISNNALPENDWLPNQLDSLSHNSVRGGKS